MRTSLVLASLVALSPFASADDIDDHWRLEGTFGLRIGSLLVNNAPAAAKDAATTAIHLGVGERRGRWNLYTEYELFLLAGVDQEAVARGEAAQVVGSGLMHRVGANARRAFARIKEHDFSVEFYGDAGLGLQHYRWDDGGYWTRPDLSFGVGFAGWVADDDAKHFAVNIGLRVLLMKRDDLGNNPPVACGGPCDAPTKPTTFDRSFMFDITVGFGR